SFVDVRMWMNTRFAFVFALWQRFQDWRQARAEAAAKKKAEKKQKELDRRAGEDRRVEDRRLVAAGQAALKQRAETDGSEVRTGAGVAGPVSAKPAAQSFERTFADMEPVGAGQLAAEPAQPQSTQVMPDAAGDAASANASAIELEPAVSARGDVAARRKTVMPKIAAGGYKLPPSSLLHRPDDQHDVNEEEVK